MSNDYNWFWFALIAAALIILVATNVWAHDEADCKYYETPAMSDEVNDGFDAGRRSPGPDK